jgi:hypothetical protein
MSGKARLRRYNMTVMKKPSIEHGGKKTDDHDRPR